MAKFRFALTIILIPVIIFLFSAIAVIHDKEFYANELAKLGSSDKFIAANEQIGSYVTGDGNLDAVAGLSAAEKSHLSDVKDLIGDLPLVFIVFSLLFFSLLERAKAKGEKRKILLYGGLAAVLIPIILAVIPFDAVFTAFHQLFFPQGNWMFAQNSLLIQVYPAQFFKDAAFRIFGQGLVAGAATAVLCFLSR